jgi:prepilin-type N-terminal cleavage/methylation domain-containing protein
MHPKRGFTLAELLVVLGVLGVVATVSIPKVLYSQQQTQLKAVFKDVYATLSDLNHQARLEGVGRFVERFDWINSRIQAVKTCPSNCQTEGCWDTTVQGNVWGTDQPGWVLANGAVITGYLEEFTYQSGFTIDINGKTAPNVVGEDIIHLDVCPVDYHDGTFVCPDMESGFPQRSGSIGPLAGMDSAVLFSQLFR